MFICAKCLEDCEGPPIAYAKAMVEAGFGSRGPCEFCGKTAVCADVPSSAPWSRKRTAEEELEKIGVRLITIKLSEEEQARIKAWRDGIEEHGQELWEIYHWIVSNQGGKTHGIYRLRDWLEKYGVPDNTTVSS